MDWRWADFDYDPTHWLAAVVRVAGRSWRRTQNRNAALYVGGVCFYGMLGTVDTEFVGSHTGWFCNI